jgi:hypothetical protein
MVIAWAQQLANQLTHPKLHLPLVGVGSLKLLVSLSSHLLPQQAFSCVGSAVAKRRDRHLRQSLTTNSYSKAATSDPVEGEALCYPSSPSFPSCLFGVGHDPCPNLLAFLAHHLVYHHRRLLDLAVVVDSG